MKSSVHYYRLLLMLAALVCGATPAAAEIQATLESPPNKQTVTGIGVVAGWAFSTDSQATVTVKLRVDDKVIGDIAWPGQRGDVAANFPSQPQAVNSGFAVGVNFSELSSGSHKIGVEISDSRGASKIIDNEVTVIRVGDFTFLSSLDLVSARPDINGKQIKLPYVEVTDKPLDAVTTEKTQQVTLTLGWQPDRQVLGIVGSENTNNATPPPNNLTNALIASPVRDSRAAEGDTIRANLENPSSLISTVSGKGLISGWAFSTTKDATVTKVQLQVDGTPIQTIPCCTPRPDVAQATENKEFPQAGNSGFATEVNFGELSTDKTHTLEVVIQTSDNDKKILPLSVTTVRLGNLPFIDEVDLSNAIMSVQSSDTLRIEKFKVHGKDSSGVEVSPEVVADFSWNADCQCFLTLSSCGDGNVGPGEECDTQDFNTESCKLLGFSGGTLGCSDTCSFETKDCTGGQTLYVTNVLDNSVSVVDTAANKETKTIPVGRSPRSIAISPDGTTAYVTNTGDDTLSVINLANNQVSETIPVGKGPQFVAVTPDGATVYIVDGKDDAVAVLNAATKQILTVKVGKEPQALALTPDGKFAYVTNYRDNSVSVIDTRTNAITKTIIDNIGKGPNGIAVTPDGKQVYVVNFDGDSISIVDSATNAVPDKPTALGLSPVRVAFAPDGALAYISSVLDFSVNAFDTAKKEKGISVPVGTEPDGLAVSAKAKRLYVAAFGRNGDANFVDVISTIKNASVIAIEVGNGPFAVALTPPKP